MPTPLKYQPVPIGVGSLFNSAPADPLLGAPVVTPLTGSVTPIGEVGVPTPAAPVVTMDSSPLEAPVAGVQTGEMRFNAGEYAQFMNSLSRANLGTSGYDVQIGDFFRRDPESSVESPSYLYTGSPIGFYGGYGVDKDGNTVKITSGNAVFQDGFRKGQIIPRDFVINSFMRELAAIDESGGGADPGEMSLGMQSQNTSSTAEAPAAPGIGGASGGVSQTTSGSGAAGGTGAGGTADAADSAESEEGISF